MADGKIQIQSTDNRIYTVTPEAGAGGNVALTLPKEGGMLTVDAEVVHKTGDTMTGNLVFASGTKIQGDFSNATQLNRTLIQTSTVNASTSLELVPNGSGVLSQLVVNTVPDNTNSSIGQFQIANAGVLGIASSARGTGPLLPMAFYTGGAERLRIDTSGNVLVTGSGGLGYGTGSGGTVTQLTSKGTAVTLNKPCGTIVTTSEALASNASVNFNFNNNLLQTGDTLILTTAENASYFIICRYVTTGVALISITNTNVISVSQSIQIQFCIIKGAIA